MRLPRVDTGHTLGKRFQLAMIRLFTREEPADVVKTLFYRPEMWGKQQTLLAQAALRGPSEWKVWERELFAAFVSRLHQCPF
jgi:hypothetical protein